MGHLLARGQRIPLLVGLTLLMASLVIACGRLELRPGETGEPVTPTPIGQPTEQPSSTPVAEDAEPLDVGATLGATLIEGRPYLRDTVPGAILYYEPWVDYQAVRQIKQVYAFTKELLQQELGITEVASVTMYLVLENQFILFAEANDFAHPSFLAGFYTYAAPNGQVVDAKVFLDATAQGLVHNAAHELAHIAMPWLPTWIGEGVADYIGARAGVVLGSPSEEELQMLQSRQMVRAALRRDMLLDLEEVESLDWVATDDYETLGLAYAQSWQLMEYIARHYAPYGLRNLVAGYREHTQQGEDPFQLVIGVSAETVWQGFSADILESLTMEESVEQGLCGLVQLANQGVAITSDWSQFLAQANLEKPEANADQFRRFGQRWEALAGEAAEFTAPGDASTVRDLWLSYFQTMVQAMEELAAGEIISANRALADANRRYSQAAAALQQALLLRPWLACF